ncbi:TetR/AcrR family transcriptional regulator [Streptomyces sp. AK04-3B]|uniref:TetR/AcrR family transcriptional regulator n=1 Tax=unclassified Streptomyces TaxID=2593676 RepID=UPI0029B8973B|nr:TetR/AcrR family transcriptional regulator [Streptomyces sp. AK04-3B]MDX3797755.1 TetR/AcrR family transcriptional regulator [Streptomyces sp. AK04-3B]
MARLTRAESQARTREHVLDTAHELFLRDGFTATSIERVAEAAGYSKGAVYSNFATKNELCLAVLDRIAMQQVAHIAVAMGDAPRIEDRLAGFARWAEQHIGDSSWTALEVEFATANRHDAQVCAQLAHRRRTVTGVLADLIRAQTQELGVTPGMPADTAALILLSLGIGIGVQRAFDPTVPVQPVVDLLQRFLTE